VTVELWMGSEFEHAHEMRALRAVLAQMVEHFGDAGDLYLLLANFFCDGEEIDLAVVKKNAVIVVELKECAAPVVGRPNGAWRIQGDGILNEGRRRNPYQQVRQYRYALMNYLTRQRFDFLSSQKARQVRFEHVSGLVVFSPTMSAGSQIEISPRDRKWFGVAGLDSLWAEINDQRSPQIRLNHGEARKLAAQALGLTRYDVQEYLGAPSEPEPTPPPPLVPVETARPPAPPEAEPSPGPAYDRLTQPVARDIVNALRRGTVPQAGLEYLAVGLDRELRAISAQLKHAATGRGDFKFVRGEYGAGKTFLSALTLEEALRQGYAVSYVVVSTDTPLYKLETIYHRAVSNLRTRAQQYDERRESALKSLIDRWLYQVEEKVIELEGYDEDDPRLMERVEAQIESGLGAVAQFHSAFSAAVRGYYRAQLGDDYPTSQALLGWLSGERQISARVKRQVNIRGDIDSTVALEFLRAVNLVARKAGLAGLAIAFDEVETIQRLRRPQREQSLNTLRQLVDAIDHGEFPYTYLMFTGTPGFFEDRQGVPALQPLHDRIKLDRPDDPFPNPELPQIVLPKFDNSKLQAVADKVLRIYEAAYGAVDRQRVSDVFIEFMIAEVTSKFGGRVDVVPRQFLRDLVNVLDKARQYPEYDPDAEYEFERAALDVELTPVEQEVIEPIAF
jgi:hypothetical protein